jgi:YggT family protein
MSMEDRTEVVQTTTAREEEPLVEHVEHVERVERPEVTQVNVGRPGPRAEYDRHEAVAYDPYADRRAVAWRFVQAIWLIFGVIEGLLAIRFALRALGANQSAGFAEFIYGLTAPFVAPFVGLFSNPASSGNVLELNTIVAMVAYGLLAWLLAKIVWLVVGEERSAVRTRTTNVETRS